MTVDVHTIDPETILREGLGNDFHHAPESWYNSSLYNAKPLLRLITTAAKAAKAVKPAPGKIPVDVIIDAVAEAHMVPLEAIMDRTSRKRKTTAARQHAYWMIKKLHPNISLSKMAAALNYHCHTDALHGVRTFEGRKRMFTAQIASVYDILAEQYEDFAREAA